MRGELVMSRQQDIEDLQNRVRKGEFQNDGDLVAECIGIGAHIYDDILSPIGYNYCDRCGALHHSDVGLLWLDDFPWEDDNLDDQMVLVGLAEEDADYCVVCYDCLAELRERGRQCAH